MLKMPTKVLYSLQDFDAIKIDGKAEEASWQKAPRSEDFIDIEGEKTPKYQTHMKMLWDEEYLYFYAKWKSRMCGQP